MSVFCLSRIRVCAIKSKQTTHLYKMIVYYEILLCRIFGMNLIMKLITDSNPFLV